MASHKTSLKVINPYLKKQEHGQQQLQQQQHQHHFSSDHHTSSSYSSSINSNGRSSTSRQNKKSYCCSTKNIGNNSASAIDHQQISKMGCSLRSCHHQPLFMDKFGSTLISQLIDYKTFQTVLMNDYNFDLNCTKRRTNEKIDSKNENINKKKVREEENDCRGIIQDEKGDEDRLRFYWRTKCFPLEYPVSESVEYHRDGHVYFLDVTVDFIKQKMVKKKTKNKKKMDSNSHTFTNLERQNNDEEDQNSNANCKNQKINVNEKKQNQKEQLYPQVQIQTRFGILMKRFKKEKKSTSSTDIIRQDDDDTTTTTSNAAATTTTVTSRKEQEKGAVYIQTNEFTKDELDEYAQNIMIDLKDTGPIATANIIAKALLAYNDNSNNDNNSNCSLSSGLRTVPMYGDSYIYNNNVHMDINSNDRKDQLMLLQDRIGIYHMDLEQEGCIHFPCQYLRKREQEQIGQQEYDENQNNTSGKIDEFALKMMVSNFILQDEERMKNHHHCNNQNMNESDSNLNRINRNDKYSNNDIVVGSGSSRGMDDGIENIFERWWNHYQAQNEEQMQDESTVKNSNHVNLLPNKQTQTEDRAGCIDSRQRRDLNQNTKEQGDEGEKDDDNVMKETTLVKNDSKTSLPSVAITNQSSVRKKNDDSIGGKKNKLAARNNDHAIFCVRPKKKRRGKMTIRRPK